MSKKTYQISSIHLKKLLSKGKKYEIFCKKTNSFHMVESTFISDIKSDHYSSARSIPSVIDALYEFVNQKPMEVIEIDDETKENFKLSFLKNDSVEIIKALFYSKNLMINAHHIPDDFLEYFKEVKGSQSVFHKNKNFMQLFSQGKLEDTLFNKISEVEVYVDQFDNKQWVLNNLKDFKDSMDTEIFIRKIPEKLLDEKEIILKIMELTKNEYRDNKEIFLKYQKKLMNIYPDDFVQFIVENKHSRGILEGFYLHEKNIQTLKEKFSFLNLEDFKSIFDTRATYIEKFIPDDVIDKPDYLAVLSDSHMWEKFKISIFENKQATHIYLNKLFIDKNHQPFFYRDEFLNKNFLNFKIDDFYQNKSKIQEDRASFLLKIFIHNMDIVELDKLSMNDMINIGFKSLSITKNQLKDQDKFNVLEAKILSNEFMNQVNLEQVPVEYLEKYISYFKQSNQKDKWIQCQSFSFRKEYFKEKNEVKTENLLALFVAFKEGDSIFLKEKFDKKYIWQNSKEEDILELLDDIEKFTLRNSPFKILSYFKSYLPSKFQFNININKKLIEISPEFIKSLGILNFHDDMIDFIMKKNPQIIPHIELFDKDDFVIYYFKNIKNEDIHKNYVKYPVHVQKLIDKAKEISPESIGHTIQVIIENYHVGKINIQPDQIVKKTKL